VNKEYIRSAAQADEFRTEPPFKLQGSYRNMNRIAEKVLPVMNPEEMKTLIFSHYENEAQTLTTGAEANLLKFKELTRWINDTEKARWEEIKKTFRRNQIFRGADGKDPVMQVVARLSAFQEGLESIRDALAAGLSQTDKGRTQVSLDSATLERMENLYRSLETALATALKEDREADRLPGLFLKTLKAQFELMNSWMEPTFKAAQVQTIEIQKLGRVVQNLKSVYREIMDAGADADWRNIERYDTTLKANPKDHKTYYKRGLVWYNKNELNRALSDFKNALDLDPKNKRYQRIVAHIEAELTTDKIEEQA
jgi:tetratricopeptide (TPR) repeat protein